MSPDARHAASRVEDAPGADFSAFDPSMALDAVVSCDEREIVARTADGLPPYLALEALAQACGLHLRRRHDFAVRAFLASVSDLVHVPGLGHSSLTIRATLIAETAAGAAYDVIMDGAPACRILMGHTPLASPDIFFRQRFEALCTRS
ncbi:hypothetical protein [Desulfomicrobium escambiense]|uniref:hypothetical protein n=1 Tax=Desulfomicrobium escambiense TaxID=29503 RepID=UPI00042627C9|nr:hypothetical protein [Desulfomicrobium escambiense]